MKKKASVFAIYAYYVKGVPLYNGRYIKGPPFSAREMTSKEQLEKFHTDDVSAQVAQAHYESTEQHYPT